MANNVQIMKEKTSNRVVWITLLVFLVIPYLIPGNIISTALATDWPPRS